MTEFECKNCKFGRGCQNDNGRFNKGCEFEGEVVDAVSEGTEHCPFFVPDESEVIIRVPKSRVAEDTDCCWIRLASLSDTLLLIMHAMVASETGQAVVMTLHDDEEVEE